MKEKRQRTWTFFGDDSTNLNKKKQKILLKKHLILQNKTLWYD
tara:strand:+ start:470 stop:598 length:129 start_codon:yes stop_codon:yes gene_type:complete